VLRGAKILLVFLLISGIWLPRGLALDRFATPDEAAWVGRSAAFFHALARRDFSGTYQHGHPGVTLTWAGALAYRWRYPAIAWEADERVLKNWKNVEPFLRERGIPPVQILATSRFFMAAGNAVALGVAFLYALRLVGFWPALLGFTLIAFDPFLVGLARLLHLDGLVSALMLLSLLAYLNFLDRGRRLFDLLVAGVAAGLSWLTRSPALFLGLFFGFLTLLDLFARWRVGGLPGLRSIWHSAWPVLLWTGMAVFTFVLLWPAMWLDPVGVVGRVFAQAFSYAAEGHDSEIFFNGSVLIGDPGWLFYPITYLWRATPAVLAGLALALLAFIFRLPPFEKQEHRRVVAVLASFAVFFGLAMSLGAKKFDRYLLPSYAPLDLLAGMGWLALVKWSWGRSSNSHFVIARSGFCDEAISGTVGTRLLRQRTPRNDTIMRISGGRSRRWWLRLAASAAVVLAFGSQMFLVIQTHPYYLSYYNPLMGGSKKAPEVMMIGWGEGLDQAARYLDAIPGAAGLRVMSHYPDGSFSYFFRGITVDLLNSWEGVDSAQLAGVDYVVLYIHQWQRRRPDPALLEYFASQQPEYVARINGLDYASVYKIPHAPE